MIAPRQAWRAAWAGMGGWRTVCLALVVLALLLAPLELLR
jgi:hypothetical protein